MTHEWDYSTQNVCCLSRWILMWCLVDMRVSDGGCGKNRQGVIF